MDQYTGVYLGFAPTDESVVGYGEMELTIDHEMISIRVATGSRIISETLRRDAFVQMERAEIFALYNDTEEGHKIASRITGYKERETGYPQFLFFTDPVEDFELLIRNHPENLGEIMGQTVLCGPKQIAEGLFEKALKSVEKLGYPVLPRLASGGKVPTL